MLDMTRMPEKSQFDMAVLLLISIERDARGVVRNTIKHASARKVAAAEGEAVRACAGPIAADFLPNRDIYAFRASCI